MREPARKKVALPILGITGHSPEALVFVRSTGVIVDDEFDLVRLPGAAAQRIDEGLLTFDGHPPIMPRMDRLQRDIAPAIKMADRVEGGEDIVGHVPKHLALGLMTPATRGRLDAGAPEPVRFAESRKRCHATRRHSTDACTSHVKDLQFCKGPDKVIDLLDHLVNNLEGTIGALEDGVGTLSVSGQVDCTCSYASAHPA